MRKSNWHILRVKPGTEAEVLPHLPSAYVPVRLSRHFNRRQRRYCERTTPLIPGYVFVDTPSRHDLRMPPLSCVIGFLLDADSTDARLLHGEVEALREVEQALRVEFLSSVSKPRVKHTFNAGDNVSFRAGHFSGVKGLQATVEKLRGLDGLTLEITKYGKSMKVDAHYSDLQLAP